MNRIEKVPSITIRTAKDKQNVLQTTIIGIVRHLYRSSSMLRMCLETIRAESRRGKVTRQAKENKNQGLRISTVIGRATRIISLSISQAPLTTATR